MREMVHLKSPGLKCDGSIFEVHTSGGAICWCFVIQIIKLNYVFNWPLMVFRARIVLWGVQVA
jgi:hypothetical protein